MDEKERLRRRIWSLLEERGVARFPRPVAGRIPNFDGAGEAARRLAEQPEFRRARVVKVNPDAPQRPVREAVLRAGKTLLVPSPRLRGGFVRIDPGRVRGREREASAIGGFMKHGEPVGLRDLPAVDLIVCGSVAADAAGGRVGKHGGYADIEAAILLELGKISEEMPVATTLHELQVVDRVPMAPNDGPVDLLVTPTRVVRTLRKYPKARIDWALADTREGEIPVLTELRTLKPSLPTRRESPRVEASPRAEGARTSERQHCRRV